MSEYQQQLICSLQVVWVAIFSYLYGVGGIHNKWIRRFVGTGWMMLGVFGFSEWLGSWSPWYLTFWPLAFSATTLPYGKDIFMLKLRDRIFQGLAFGVAPAAMAINNHCWSAWFFHIGLCLAACVSIGAFNIFPNARKNETLIATFCFLLALFMVSKP